MPLKILLMLLGGVIMFAIAMSTIGHEAANNRFLELKLYSPEYDLNCKQKDNVIVCNPQRKVK